MYILHKEECLTIKRRRKKPKSLSLGPYMSICLLARYLGSHHAVSRSNCLWARNLSSHHAASVSIFQLARHQHAVLRTPPHFCHWQGGCCTWGEILFNWSPLHLVNYIAGSSQNTKKYTKNTLEKLKYNFLDWKWPPCPPILKFKFFNKKSF